MPDIQPKGQQLLSNTRVRLGMSKAHAAWKLTKEKAKADGLDVSVFNLNLGKALDDLAATSDRVPEEEKGDPEWKDAIQTCAAEVRRILHAYREMCDRKAEKHRNDDQYTKWTGLKTRFNLVAGNAWSSSRPWGITIT